MSAGSKMPRTVLLADDSVTIRRVVELTFCDTDIRVESVATGREALRRFEEIRPDLVLADVVMPEPAGYEICRTIKASDRPVPVLLLAGTFEPFDPVRARECGSDGHLVKPFDAKSLVDHVVALLDRGPTQPGDVSHAAAAAPPPVDPHLQSMLEDLRTCPATADLPDEAPLEPSGDANVPAPPAEPTWSPVQGSMSPATDRSALTDEEIDRIARRVVERLSERVLREIAWDVVPDLAEIAVRERLRELEREET